MKKTSLFSCLVLASGIAYSAEEPAKPAAAVPAEAPVAVKPAEPVKSPEEIAKDEQSYLETFGWIMGQRAGVTDLGLSEKDMESFIKGLRAAISGKECPYELHKIGPEMQKFLEKKATAYQEVKEKLVMEKSTKNKAEAKTFIEKLQQTEKDLVKSASGLYYKIINKGSDVKPTERDVVKIHYEGKLINGKVFDSSKARGQAATFSLERVIPGFQEGLRVIGKGGKATLYIPSELGYGDNDLPSIPAGSLLIFDVELIDTTTPPEPKKEEVAPGTETMKTVEVKSEKK